MPTLSASLLDYYSWGTYELSRPSRGAVYDYMGTGSAGSSTGPVNTPPTIQNFSPSTGSQIYPTTVLGFDVLDSGSFRRIIVHAYFSSSNGAPSGTQDVVHDGNIFGVSYQGAYNVRTPITGGYQYRILRDGGWIGDPFLTPYAIDTTGSENS